MNFYPKVSVLLAAYNSGKTIKESIRSVLSQSYPDLQLIICDDGTKEFHEEEIKLFAREQNAHATVKVIHQPENVGTVRNLNAGLKQADGDWIMLMAADDCFASERSIECLIERGQESGQQWVVARTALCDEQLSPRGWSLPSKEVSDILAAGDLEALYLRLCTGCCLPVVGSAYKTELLRQLGGFDETYRLTEDWPLFLKLVRQGILPTVSEEELVLHRFGGVSRKNAGKNFAYQHDLITVLRKEVAPHIDLLDEQDQKTVRRLLRNKEAGFEFRFSCHTNGEKVLWMMQHPFFMFCKIFQKREKM